jgi:DNA polymerase
VLGLGYQMGAAKFVSACKTLAGVDISEEFSKEVVTTYRQANSKIVELWKNLNAHAHAAVEMRQPPECSIPVRYYREGEWLFCELPSGRTLKYARPRIVPREMPWTDDEGNPVVRDCIQVQGFNGMTRKWERQYLYGGLLAENITQAVARDLMAEAMVRVENAGYNVILTVHDEVVSEAPDTIGSVDEFEKLMCVIPAWAAGCPVAAEAWTGLRYKK